MHEHIVPIVHYLFIQISTIKQWKRFIFDTAYRHTHAHTQTYALKFLHNKEKLHHYMCRWDKNQLIRSTTYAVEDMPIIMGNVCVRCVYCVLWYAQHLCAQHNIRK